MGYFDNRRARRGLRSLLETDCRARCRLRFSAFAQRKNEGLVSLCRRPLPCYPTLALAQTFTVWRHSKFPLILVPPPSSLAVGLGDSAGRLSTHSVLSKTVSSYYYNLIVAEGHLYISERACTYVCRGMLDCLQRGATNSGYISI